MAVDPNEVIDYDGTPTAIKDLPSDARAQFGLGHPRIDIEVRERHPGPWAYAPEDCPRAFDRFGIWINNEQNLVCPGCGLDYT